MVSNLFFNEKSIILLIMVDFFLVDSMNSGTSQDLLVKLGFQTEISSRHHRFSILNSAGNSDEIFILWPRLNNSWIIGIIDFNEGNLVILVI